MYTDIYYLIHHVIVRAYALVKTIIRTWTANQNQDSRLNVTQLLYLF